MTIIRCIDLETDGLDPGSPIVEVGWCDVRDDDQAGPPPVGPATHPAAWRIGPIKTTLADPGRPISPASSAVHHIVDEDVAGALPFAEIVSTILAGAGERPILAAHVARFERSQFDPPGARWVCTYKVALALAPNAPGHKLQELRYWLKLDVDRATASPPHRAGPDAYVTAHLLARMLKKLSIDEMIEISSRPSVLPRLTFGKHAMQPIEEIPSGYLEWMLKQSDMDEDARHTAFVHLNHRRQNPKEEASAAPYP